MYSNVVIAANCVAIGIAISITSLILVKLTNEE